MKTERVMNSLLFAVAIFQVVLADVSAQMPNSLEDKIDILTHSVPYNDTSAAYFINLGPDAIPIVVSKLIGSLAEQSFPEANQETSISNMPSADQVRLHYQVGLVSMLSISLRNMNLQSDVKSKVLSTLSLALDAPYIHVRRRAINSLGNSANQDAAEILLKSLYDSDLSNRVITAQMLAKVDDTSVAGKIREILEERQQGLTEDEIARDSSFRHGYAAIEELERKSASLSTSAATTPTPVQPTPIPSATSTPPPLRASTPAITESSPATTFPVVPVVITAVILLMSAVFFIRRKRP